MKTLLHKTCPGLVAFGALTLAPTSRSATIVNDTFTGADNTNGNTIGYYLIRNAGAGITGDTFQSNQLVVDYPTTGTTQNTGIYKKFTTTSLAVGESINVTFDLTFNQAISTTGNAFRIMLGNSTVSGTGAVNFDAFPSDTTFIALRLANGTGTSASINSYNGVTNITTAGGTSNPFTQGSGGIPLTNAITSVSFTLTSTAPGMDVTGSLNGNSVGAFSRTGAEALTSFNLFGIYQNSTSNNLDFTIDNVVISTVPEPGTWALLAMGLTTVMVFRRRRTA